jgi:hypothetical protein
MADSEVDEAPSPEPEEQLEPLEHAEPVLPVMLDSQMRVLELRSYQQCALQRARERNVIMVGATGIGERYDWEMMLLDYYSRALLSCPGKTLVAIKLLQELDVNDGR